MTAYHRYRLYEMLPGISIWLSFLLAIIFSIFFPVWMIYFIIIFDVYWVLRVLNFSFYLLLSWRRLRQTVAIDWEKKMRCELTPSEISKIPHGLAWNDVIHVIFLTLYNEDWHIVETTLSSIKRAVYQPDRFVIVIAGEGRAKAHYDEIVLKARAQFSDCFFTIIGTCHPDQLEGEIPGKGSNLHYAEGEVRRFIDAQKWAYDRVVATIFDIDTVCHEQYFRYLTYLYCMHPRRTRSSYQPVALYNNNIWESPAILRIMAFGTTFWMLMSLARQDALVTFSSHSISFQALLDAGFHDKRIVSEDSRIFYQCLLAYNGDYHVTPMYMPVSMDTVRDPSWWQSIKNLYKQQRRWAWGVEHIPYLLWEFRKKGRAIPWRIKAKWIFVEWEGKWSWCLVALFITVLGRLPLWLAGPSVRQSALFFNAPHTLETIMQLAMVGLLLSAVLSFPLLPKPKESHPPHRYLFLFFQWALVPLTLIFVSALPAIDAVTHLMFGRYLGFNVSQKKRLISS